MQVLEAGLALGPGLQLARGIPGRIEVMVAGDVGQLRLVEHAIVLVLQGPGLKFGLWMTIDRNNHGNPLAEESFLLAFQ